MNAAADDKRGLQFSFEGGSYRYYYVVPLYSFGIGKQKGLLKPNNRLQLDISLARMD
jgi:hypothetical protein